MDIAAFSLIVQIFVLAIILLGYIYFRRKNLWLHGVLLVIATAIYSAAIFTIMVPLFLASPQNYIPNLGIVGIGNSFHIVLGCISEILAVFISARWIINRFDSRGCAGKELMRLTMLLWLASLLSGILTYFVF